MASLVQKLHCFSIISIVSTLTTPIRRTIWDIVEQVGVKLYQSMPLFREELTKAAPCRRDTVVHPSYSVEDKLPP